MSDAPPPSNPRPPARSWADLGPRFSSAAVLIGVTLVCVALGGWFFSVFIAALFGGIYREWETMVTRARAGRFAWVLIGLVALAAALFPVLRWQGTVGILFVAGVVALFGGSARLAWRLGGLFYFGLVMLSLLVVRAEGTAGIWVGLFVVAVVWTTDSAAFFTGRQIGGEKLAPEISPSKTWSGALGGLAFGTIAGTIAWFILADGPLWLGALYAAVISVLGQVGDLTESAIKRHFRVKDSGDIIPGHGGLMDRLDSLTLGIIFVACVGLIHGGAAAIPQGFLNW